MLYFLFIKVLSANHNGEMKLMVETDMVSISTHFRDLVNPVSEYKALGDAYVYC